MCIAETACTSLQRPCTWTLCALSIPALIIIIVIALSSVFFVITTHMFQPHKNRGAQRTDDSKTKVRGTSLSLHRFRWQEENRPQKAESTSQSQDASFQTANTHIVQPCLRVSKPDHKLRGSLYRSLEKATLISSPPTIILIELSNMSNAKGVLIIMNHH